MKQPYTDIQNLPEEWIIILDITLLSKIGHTDYNKHLIFKEKVFTDTANYLQYLLSPSCK